MIKKIKKIIKILFNLDKPIMSHNDAIQYQRVKPWFEIDGDTTLRLNYDLNQNSLVFDLGGYKGEFAQSIFCKYQSTVYVFEPIQKYYEIIKNKFSHNPNVKAYNFGLSSENETCKISLLDNSSSTYINSSNSETIELKSITEFLDDNKIENINLIKINIEGGEYEVLRSLLENNKIKVFENIQVQFHDFIFENALEKMNEIKKQLELTHSLTYEYEFVWENWKRNDSN